jgi:hypothetical protein
MAVSRGYSRSENAAPWRTTPRITRWTSRAGSAVFSSGATEALAAADEIHAPSRVGGGVGRRFLRRPGDLSGAGDSPANAVRGAFLVASAGCRSAGVRITVAVGAPLRPSADAVFPRCAAKTTRPPDGVAGRSTEGTGSEMLSGSSGRACRLASSRGRGIESSARSCSNRAHIRHSPVSPRGNSYPQLRQNRSTDLRIAVGGHSPLATRQGSARVVPLAGASMRSGYRSAALRSKPPISAAA